MAGESSHGVDEIPLMTSDRKRTPFGNRDSGKALGAVRTAGTAALCVEIVLLKTVPNFACRMLTTLAIMAGISLTGHAGSKNSLNIPFITMIYMSTLSIRHRPAKLQYFPFQSCDTIVTGMALTCDAGTGSHGVIIG